MFNKSNFKDGMKCVLREDDKESGQEVIYNEKDNRLVSIKKDTIGISFNLYKNDLRFHHHYGDIPELDIMQVFENIYGTYVEVYNRGEQVWLVVWHLQ